MALSLRRSLRSVELFRSCFRDYSSAGKLVAVDVNDKTGIATVTMQRAPVNGLNLELLTELSSALTQLEQNKTRGMILTSSLGTIFSGGLDILEMYKPNPERVKSFWTTLQDTWLKLYGSSFPTVAAINGHSPAGGCLLAMSCEYRVMVKNYTIGLNETALGIVAPPWFIASMRNTVSKRDAELALTMGRLFTTDDALKVGLVDEVAENKDEAVTKCAAFLGRFAKIPPVARALTKKSLRQNDLQDLIDNREKDLQVFLSYVTNEAVQKGLELYLESLKKKKA